LFDEA